MPEPLLNLAHLASPVTSLGPGRRLVLWVAGCSLNCAGCITPELKSPAAGKAIAVDRLADYILSRDGDLDGITLSGGEPFEQAPALARLWMLLSDRHPDWNLLIFSGYPYQSLRRRQEAEMLLALADLLIAGPFRPDRPADRPLVASANQERLALSKRGEGMVEQLARQAVSANLGREASGRGWLIGILDPIERQQIHQRLGLSSSLDFRAQEEVVHG